MTQWVENRANELLRDEYRCEASDVRDRASRRPPRTKKTSSLPYVKDLRNVVDMEAIRSAGLKLGVDPLGGAAVPYWEPINSVYSWISPWSIRRSIQPFRS